MRSLMKVYDARTTTSLGGVVAKINKAAVGVTASVVSEALGKGRETPLSAQSRDLQHSADMLNFTERADTEVGGRSQRRF